MKGILFSKRNRMLILVSAMLVLALLACTGGGGTDSSTGAVQVINNSTVEICYIYISPSTDDTWGEDKLDDTETVSAGASRTFSGLTPGQYDFRADDCSQTEIDSEVGVDVPAGQTITWTFTDN
jgi:hypothetical protein